MYDFSADIKKSKQQSVKRKKAAFDVLDEIFKAYILSEDNAVIICTIENCRFITYDRYSAFLENAARECELCTQILKLPFTVEKIILEKYYLEFSAKYSEDFNCFVVNHKYYCFAKKYWYVQKKESINDWFLLLFTL